MQLAESLRRGLRQWDLAELDAHGGTIYGVDDELRLGFFNATWFRFAAENEGEPAISRDWPLGRCLLDCIPPVLRPRYADAYRDAIRTRLPWRHEYECSTPSRYRRFHQFAYALEEGAGLLVVNSLVVDRAHDPRERPAHAADVATYAGARGLVTQCSYCRRVRHPDTPERWDWVPAWVRHAPRETSHGICPPCFRFHYPGAAIPQST
jgi:hypothetical protein